jgi:response regulator RpfG family c-di-GMP phosphodiesterase
LRVLLVDDDAPLRTLLRTTLAAVAVEVEEAESAAAALARIASRLPDVVVLDVHMPGMNGLELSAQLKREPRTAGVQIVLLTGGGTREADAARAGADAYLRKPFSPLELLAVVDRLAGRAHGVPFGPAPPADASSDALLLYAHDLRHVLEIERSQRAALQEAYLETVTALATALDTKDTGTRAHSQRVQRYACALARRVDERVLDDRSVEYGFLLHDVGKIGISDAILQKPGPLTSEERRRVEMHTIIGEQMLSGVAYLRGEGLSIVRSHHERWDGRGYPDSLTGLAIPIGARIFAVADALDAMTSDRPYRAAHSWDDARREIEREAGRQFDPAAVDAFERCQDELDEIREELVTAA